MAAVPRSDRDLLDRIARLESQVGELARRTGKRLSPQRDGHDAVVLAPDDTTGTGLARPFIPIVFQPVPTTAWPSTPATSPALMWHANIYKQHPAISVVIGTYGAGTAGNVRLTVNGSPAWIDIPVTNGVANYVTAGPVPVPGAHMSDVLIELWGWRTGGSGTVQVIAYNAYGLELRSPQSAEQSGGQTA